MKLEISTGHVAALIELVVNTIYDLAEDKNLSYGDFVEIELQGYAFCARRWVLK